MNVEWHRAHRMPVRATVDARLVWHLEHEQACTCRPMPAPLQKLDAERTRESLRHWLDGRDSRSLAQSVRARALIEARPARIGALADLAGHANWVVAMRALDLLEKFVRAHPDWVQPHRRVFLTAADSDRWLIRLQVVRALPHLRWTPRERRRAIAILKRDVSDPQTFVRAWALDGLATFAARDRSLRSVVLRALAVFDRSSSPALHARARHIRARLDA